MTLLAVCLLLGPAHAARSGDPPAESPTISEPGSDPGTENHTEAASEQELFLVRLVRDPGEPFNRGSYRATRLIRRIALDPLARGWGLVLPERVRDSVDSMATNLRFPGRFVNDLLQLRPRAAGIELARFVTNSTVGLAGLFDPAARMGLRAPEPEDLGQTFGRWGVTPGFFVFLPVLGPSSLRDAIGLVGDLALDPATWVPGAGAFFEFNRFSLNVESIADLEAQEADPYGALRDLWAVTRERAVRNYTIPESDFNARPVSSLYAVLLLKGQAPEPETRTIELAGGERLDYALWPGRTQRLVFILPGLGGFRVSGLVRTLASRISEAGYTVVSISNPFHREFIDGAGQGALPGFTPDDVTRVRAVLARIAGALRESSGAEPHAVVGASLGGLYSLFLAAEADREDALGFERFVAINPPVDTLYALQQLDEYYAAALEWPNGSRRAHIEGVLLKAAVLGTQTLGSDLRLPFDSTESRFLIGATYRHVLRDTIFVTQQLRNLQVLRRTWTDVRREPVYREIAAFSYEEYMHDFVLPFQNGPSSDASPATRIERTGVRWLEPRLVDEPRLRVFTNADDFLLHDSDLAWLRSTLGSRLRVFPHGGHLGNLVDPDVLDAIVQSLEPQPLDPGTPRRPREGDSPALP